MLRKLTWLVFRHLPYVMYILFPMYIYKVFEGVPVPANTVLDGKLFQLFVTLLIKNKMYILISKNCLM